VNNRVQDANLGAVPYAGFYQYAFGFPLAPYPANHPLVRGKPYYWTVDATDVHATYAGDIWWFMLKPYEAYNPTPPNDTDIYIIGASLDMLLSWETGWGTDGVVNEHDVYFGTNWADVNNAVLGTPGIYKATQATADVNYLMTGLVANQDYYWRIDEVVGRVLPFVPGTIYKGPVWHFRTLEPLYHGLRGEYYHHTGGAAPAGFQTFVTDRIDPDINFQWGTGSPAPGLVNNNDFSVRWTGWVVPSFSEIYTFYATTDDGVRLWVDNQLIINDWVDRGPTQSTSTPIALNAGKKYDIKMEYYENGGGAVAELRWSSASTPMQIIPSEALMPVLPNLAWNPIPADGAKGVDRNTKLMWTPGMDPDAASQFTTHDVYLSTNFNDVNTGTTPDATVAGPNEYTPPSPLAYYETYYWRIDGVNTAGDPYRGNVWQFTVIWDSNNIVDPNLLTAPK
jgi:hypothetical protein